MQTNKGKQNPKKTHSLKCYSFFIGKHTSNPCQSVKILLVTEHVVDLAHLELQKAFEKSSYQKILKTELDKRKEENPLKI